MNEIYERPPVSLNDAAKILFQHQHVFKVDSGLCGFHLFRGWIERWFKWIRFVTIALHCPPSPHCPQSFRRQHSHASGSGVLSIVF